MKELDMQKYHIIAPPEKDGLLTVTVTAAENLTMMQKLSDKIVKRKAAVILKNDGKELCLDAERSPAFSFPPQKGTTKASTVAAELKSLGIRLPAVYAGRWDEEQKFFQGYLRQKKSPPSPEELVKQMAKKIR